MKLPFKLPRIPVEALKNASLGAAAALVFLAAFSVAPIPGLEYRRARFYEGTRRYPMALKQYEKLLARAPEQARAPELHVRAGELYARKYQRCVEARRHFEAAGRMTTEQPWAARARAGIMDCPDYFPLEPGRTWVYGDSQSGGKFMRLEWQLRESAGEKGVVLASMYAGQRKLKTDRNVYEKRDWMVFEGAAPILRYPYRAGATWEAARGGEKLRYRIEAEDAKVTTAAGTFENCLKVREINAKLPNSFKYDYYAPFVGRVKTTVGGPGFENPNTELIRYTTGG